MSTFDKCMTIFLIFSVSLGMNLVFHRDAVERFEGYHCQPITEHKTLEEAKARIEQYQAMVRG